MFIPFLVLPTAVWSDCEFAFAKLECLNCTCRGLVRQLVRTFPILKICDLLKLATLTAKEASLAASEGQECRDKQPSSQNLSSPGEKTGKKWRCFTVNQSPWGHGSTERTQIWKSELSLNLVLTFTTVWCMLSYLTFPSPNFLLGNRSIKPHLAALLGLDGQGWLTQAFHSSLTESKLPEERDI